MPEKPQCCKTCRFLQITLNSTGNRVVREQNSYNCTCPIPELPPMPESTIMHFSWNRQRIMPDEGENCPAWEMWAKPEDKK